MCGPNNDPLAHFKVPDHDRDVAVGMDLRTLPPMYDAGGRALNPAQANSTDTLVQGPYTLAYIPACSLDPKRATDLSREVVSQGGRSRLRWANH